MKHTYVVPYPQVTWNHTVQGIGPGDNSGLGQLGVSIGEAPEQRLLRDASLGCLLTVEAVNRGEVSFRRWPHLWVT